MRKNIDCIKILHEKRADYYKLVSGYPQVHKLLKKLLLEFDLLKRLNEKSGQWSKKQITLSVFLGLASSQMNFV